MRIRSYSELKSLKTLKERFDYLKIGGEVGRDTFGFDRYLNQLLYTSSEWRKARREVIIRDNGCDLGIPGYEIQNRLIVHHMNPITVRAIEERDPDIFNPEFLICTAFMTHQGIHYGDESFLPRDPIERFPGDTKLW